MSERLRAYFGEGDWKITTTFDFLAKKEEPVHIAEIAKHLTEKCGRHIHYIEAESAVKYLKSKGLVEAGKEKYEPVITKKGLKIYKLLEEVGKQLT